MNQMVNKNNKYKSNNNKNSSNSLVFGQWPRAKTQPITIQEPCLTIKMARKTNHKPFSFLPKLRS